jgi:alanyl-tRNA synthetase
MSREDRALISETASALKVARDQMPAKVVSLTKEIKELHKTISDIEKSQAGDFAGEAIKAAEDIGGIKAVIVKAPVADAAALRDTADKIRDSLDNGVVFLAAEADGKVLFTAMASKSAVAKGVHCGNIIKEAARVAGGGGGGRPDMAQAGGKDVTKIDDALAAAKSVLASQLG